MTDEEMKRLEELAKGSIQAFAACVEPREVLALIERVRQAEKKLETIRNHNAATRAAFRDDDPEPGA